MTTPSRAAQLRSMLHSNELEFILEAHNGISARIVEEAGFKGIWASGLALSAQFGVRDNNEASWTQVVDVLEFMADVTHIPILLDGDTGYGNFNNLRRLVRKLEQRGIAGVCIEDKLFPKTNSFIDGERQPLADLAEFCGKIAAGKDSQNDSDFCIVARVEALIAGWDIDEALRRAAAYHAAGADAILIHSKRSRPDEILEFMRLWQNRAPVVIVPTKYYSTPTETFRAAGVSMVIWANHLIRAAVSAMQATALQIRREQSLRDIEDRIAPVQEIFRLQGADELTAAEQRYLAAERAPVSAVVLGATEGKGLAELTAERPKMMVPIAGKSILRRLADEFKKCNVHRITAVTGYRADAVVVPGVHTVHNPDYATSGELVSLAAALPVLTENTVFCYGDLLFRSYVLEDLLDNPAPLTVVVDSAFDRCDISGTPDFAYCSHADDLGLWRKDVLLCRVSNEDGLDGRRPDGRWIGLFRARGEGVAALTAVLGEMLHEPAGRQYALPDLLNRLIARGHPIRVKYIQGHWLDVNSLHDLERAGRIARGD
ncbi:MAG: phosphoenolpyruvate mutase [Gammaproteobacteria bacterium]|nr:phosphoenolpyruvate mutase [Gammaproteobacteria bacterium]